MGSYKRILFTAPLIIGSLFLFQNCGGGFETLSFSSAQFASQLNSNDEFTHEEVQPKNAKAMSLDPESGSLQVATYGSYSPEVVDPGRFVFGGWMTASDPTDYLRALDDGADPKDVVGPDKIFITDLGPNPTTTKANVRLALSLKGYHINDPTIVNPPSTEGIDRSGWKYMYFTMLDNALAEDCRRRKVPLLECPEVFTGHDVGFASSVDGGQTWEYRGIVIRAVDSADGSGAWMPSAEVVGGEIYLYYSSGRQNFDQENLFLQKISGDGFTKVGTPIPLRIAGFQKGNLYANVDVKSRSLNDTNQFLMSANSGDQKKLHLFFSHDGVNFTEVSESPIIVSKESDQVVLTPAINSFDSEQLAGPGGGEKQTDFLYVFLQYGTHRSTTSWELRRSKFLINSPFVP